MSKITNNGQYNQLYTGRIAYAKNGVIIRRDDVIHKECNKPLQSKSWVTTNQKSKFDWSYTDGMRNRFYLRRIGNFYYEVEKPKYKTIDDVKIQKKANEERIAKIEKQKEKLVNETRARAIKLLSGLASSPNYSRIYA